MYSMQSTDSIGAKIKHTLADIKAFLTHDVESLLDCVLEYQTSLTAAMKKGDKLKLKLHEMGSQNKGECSRYFAQIEHLQHILNESQSLWITSMKDLFVIPLKGMLPGNLTALKKTSKMTVSALMHFDREQEKSRGIVQELLSKPTLMSSVQPYLQHYDEMKAQEELFSTKKQEILRELERFRLDRAYEIGYLWTQVCDKQPHLPNKNLVERFRIESQPPLPLSDWTSYCKFRKSALPYLLNGADPRQGSENRTSLASSLYRGLKHIFRWNPKAAEYPFINMKPKLHTRINILNAIDSQRNENLRRDLDSSTGSTADLYTNPSIQVSPHNDSILLSDSPSTPTFSQRLSLHTFLEPTDLLTPVLSPIPAMSSPQQNQAEPAPTLTLNQQSSDASSPSLLDPSAYTSSLDSPVFSSSSSTPLTVSEGPSSCSNSSPSIILEHLSPCLLEDSLLTQSNASEPINQSYESQESQGSPQESPQKSRAAQAYDELLAQLETDATTAISSFRAQTDARTKTKKVRYAQDFVLVEPNYNDAQSADEDIRGFEYSGDLDSIETNHGDSDECWEANYTDAIEADFIHESDYEGDHEGDFERNEVPRKAALGKSTTTQMEEWIPSTSASGHVVYVKKAEDSTITR